MYTDNVDKLDAQSFYDRELYREIFSIESELDRSIKINEMRTRAKMFGCLKAFDSNITEYKRELTRIQKVEEAKNKQVVTEKKYVTDFPTRDTDSQFLCGNWICDRDGIKFMNERGLLVVACPHPIYPTRILRNGETGKYKIELEYVVRGKVRQICVDREITSAPSKIVKLANDAVQVNALNAPYLVQYLSDIESMNPELVEEVASTSRLGWTDYYDEDGHKQKRFLPYQQDVVFDSEISVKPLFDSIVCRGSRDRWMKLIKGIREKRQIEVLINLAASFASVLVEPCGTLPFIVSLWGGTGIGKSVILKICTSVWADPGEGKYITDAKATNTAMEIRLNILNSLPMTLDDMAQVKNQYDEDFSELIYRWCAGKGRDRSNKDLGLNRLTSWRNCTITNGEQSLIDEQTQGGAVNRVIDIEASGEVLFDGRSGNKVVECIEKNFGFAGEDFIKVIDTLGFDEINRIYSEQYQIIKDITEAKGVEKEEKQIVPMALIFAADYLTEKFIFQDGVTLNKEACIDFLKSKNVVSENERAYEYLINTISQNRFKFADNKDENVNASEIWGFYTKPEEIAINGKVFNQILSGGNYNSKTFLSWCKKKKLVQTDKDGNPKKNVKFKGAQFRAVVLDLTYGMNDEMSENDGFISVPDDLPYN